MSKCVDEIIKIIPFKMHGYEFQSLIGKGAYGCVIKVVHIQKGHSFAAKIVFWDPIKHKNDDLGGQEFNCLINLLHPNIIKIYDIFKEGNFIFFILELCGKGSLDKYIRTQTKLSEVQLLKIMKDVLNAVEYCHSKGIAHRDIKPANILIADNGLTKLGDFGFGVRIKENEKVSNFCGTQAYKAPEIIKRIPHDPLKADIWSLGVAFYQIATGTIPWQQRKMKVCITFGLYSFPPNVPKSIMNIISKMIVVNPLKRCSAHELLESESFSILNKKFKHFASSKELRSAPVYIKNSRVVKSYERMHSIMSSTGKLLIKPKRTSNDSILIDVV